MNRHNGRHCGCGHGHGFHGVMSVEEEVEMLEKIKGHLESQLGNVNERLLKLKE